MSEMKKEEPREMNLVPTENVDKRTEFSKTYTVGPGKYQAFTSVIPLHRQNEETGKWEELDAAFKATKEDDQLESVGAQLTVSCGVSGEKPFMVIRDQKDHCLSWGLEGAEAVKPEALKEEIKEEDHVIQAFRQAMANAQGTVRYTEIFPGVDMICRNDSCFKDEFIFKDWEAARPVVFRIETEGMKLSRDEEEGIVLFDTDGKKVYNIPAPTLIDNKGQEGEIHVYLEERGESYRLIYEPDPEFMGSAAYPVVLDPAVQTYSQNLGIKDTYVINNYPNKNYSSSATLQIFNYSVTNQYASAHITSYALVKVTSLPPLGANHYITNATLHFSPAVTDLFLREITGDWSPETVKWTNRPSVSSIVQDYDLADNGKTSFNVTGLIRKWYEGDNKGVQISNEQLGTVAILQSSESSNADNRPYLSVEYASLAGLEDYLTYDTVSAGKAGTGHVSLANGNLIFSHSDTVMNGARMPVSVTHVYNSCDADKNEFFCGYGWRTNFHQTLHKELLNEIIYYVYTDGDGTEHWFKPDENSGNYKDESGLSMELTVGNLTTIRDKGDNVLTFPLITATPTITQPTAKVLVTSIADACGNRITVTADGMKITMLTDGAIIGGDPNTGRKTKFEYENDLLVGIRTPWQEENDNCIRFSYASQRLTGITYEDGNSSSYSYYTQSSLAHRLLTKAVSPEGIRAEFTYENLSVVDGLPHVVRTAKVSDGQANDELVASNTEYQYGTQLCLVTDQLTGNCLRYHFNDNGNCTSVDDGLGYAVYTKYDRNGLNESAPINHPTSVSRVERVVNNLLTNGLFARTSGWTKYGTGTIAQSYYNGEFGVNQKRFEVANGKTLYCRQAVNVTAEQTYTLSGYVRSMGPKAYLRVIAGNATFTSLPVELTGNETETELTRTQITFTVPPNVTSVSCDLVAVGTARGTLAWWDSVQLETGETANHVNLLENSYIRQTGGNPLPTPWECDNTQTSAIARPDSMPSHLIGNAFLITGHRNLSRTIWQDIKMTGTAGSRFTAGGWCAAYGKKPEGSQALCELRVYFTADTVHDDWSDWALGGVAKYNHEEGSWQFACGDIKAPVDFTWVRFAMVYSRQVNAACFSNLFLYKEKYGTDYTYDDQGNQQAASGTTDKEDGSEYNDYNNLTSYKAPGRDVATTYYWGGTEQEQRRHLLQKATSPLGIVSTFSYDAHGNRTESKVSESESSAAKFIKSTAAYTDEGNYVASQTDARGKTVTTVTDPNKGVVTSVTDPMTHVVNTTYDALRRPTKTSTMLNGQEVKTESAYDAAKNRKYGVYPEFGNLYTFFKKYSKKNCKAFYGTNKKMTKHRGIMILL